MTNSEIRLEKAIKSATSILEKNGLFGDVGPYMDDMPVITVEIDWGDWKHEHLATNWVLEEAGFTFMGEEITEEDGSDTYSSIHRYIVPMID